MTPVPQAFALALQHHQAGRVEEAEALYRQILAVQPSHADAWHMLGVIAHRAGRRDVALEWIRRAISLDPKNPASHYNLGNALKDQGQLDEAIDAFHQALALQPTNAEAHNNLGNILHARGRFEEALVHCRRAVELKPEFAPAHYNLGNALKDLGRLEEASAAYRRGIAIDHDCAQAHNRLGIALSAQKKYEEAVAAFREAVRLSPASPEAHHNLGLALVQQRQMDEAIGSYRQALALKPDYADAHVNLGLALREQGQLDEAIAQYTRALELRPDFAEAHNNLGNTLVVQGKLDQAIAAYRQSLRCQPDNPRVHSNIILALHTHPEADARTIGEEQQRWNRQFTEPVRRFIPAHENDRSPERRLRIGYVSPDFRDHVVGRNLVPLFRRHDHEQFAVVCYSEATRPDLMTAQFRQQADAWRDTADVPDETVGEMIREDRIDILVDLAQHTGGNRLSVFARRPAPLQLSFAGYPGSTGVEAIEYRISDQWLESETGDRSSEFGIRNSEFELAAGPDLHTPHSALRTPDHVFLIDSFWCYDPCGAEIMVNRLPAQERGAVTFGCLNSFSKINEPLLALWALVLAQVVGSRLVLLSAEGSHRRRTLDFFARAGIETERVEFFLPRPRLPYLEIYHQIDVMLDTFPYNGHTSTLDALWMGVPVVSLAGAAPVSRGGLSILSNLGLPEFVAYSTDDYMSLATGLARDLPRLADLRATLRARMESSPLMDAPRFAQQIEAGYRAVWRQWCLESRDAP